MPSIAGMNNGSRETSSCGWVLLPSPATPAGPRQVGKQCCDTSKTWGLNRGDQGSREAGWQRRGRGRTRQPRGLDNRREVIHITSAPNMWRCEAF